MDNPGTFMTRSFFSWLCDSRLKKFHPLTRTVMIGKVAQREITGQLFTPDVVAR